MRIFWYCTLVDRKRLTIPLECGWCSHMSPSVLGPCWPRNTKGGTPGRTFMVSHMYGARQRLSVLWSNRECGTRYFGWEHQQDDNVLGWSQFPRAQFYEELRARRKLEREGRHMGRREALLELCAPSHMYPTLYKGRGGRPKVGEAVPKVGRTPNPTKTRDRGAH
jgi:hypothetical protein